MAIIKALLIGVFFFILPTLVGMNFTRFIKEEKDNIIYSFILGYIVEFGIFQIYAIPCIVSHQSFSLLYNLFIGTVCALSILSIILNVKNYKSIFIHTIVITLLHMTLELHTLKYIQNFLNLLEKAQMEIINCLN